VLLSQSKPLLIAAAIGIVTAAVGSPIRSIVTLSAAFLMIALIQNCLIRLHSAVSLVHLYLSSIIIFYIVAFGLVMYQSHNGIVHRTVVIFAVTVLGAIVLRQSDHIDDTSLRHRTGSSSDISELGVLIVPLLLLGLRGYVPLIPASVALSIGVVLWGVLSTTPARIVLVTLAITCVGWSRHWTLGEPFWYWLSFDQLYRSSLATGLVRWGYNDLNSAAGLTIHYHWLSEALAGLFGLLGGSDEFVVVTRVLPPILFVGCFGVIWSLARSIGASQSSAYIGASLPCLILLETDPYSIGTLGGVLVFGCVAIKCQSGIRDRIYDQMYVAALLLLLLMTQTPFGVVATGMVILYFLMDKPTVAMWRRRRLLALAPIVLLPVVLRMTLLRPGDEIENSGSISLRNILGFSGFDVPFGVDAGSPWWLRISNSTAFLIELVLLSVPAVIAANWRREPSIQLIIAEKSIRFAVPLCVSTLCFANVVDIGIAQGKLFSGVLVTLFPMSAAIAWQFAFARGVSYLVSASFAVFLTAFSYRTARTASPDSIAAVTSVLIVVLAVLVCGLWIRGHLSDTDDKKANGKFRSATLLTAIPLVVVFGIAFGRQERVIGYLKRVPIPETAVLGSREIQECLEWIRTQTPSDVIVATDIFDPESLPNSGKLYLVSALTKRRVWIDGLYHSRRYFSKETERRLSLISTPTAMPKEVRYFVLHQRSSVIKASSSEFVVRIANRDCTVFERLRS